MSDQKTFQTAIHVLPILKQNKTKNGTNQRKTKPTNKNKQKNKANNKKITTPQQPSLTKLKTVKR